MKMDDLLHLVKIIKMKRSAAEQLLKIKKPSDPGYEWIRGCYDSLAHVLGEIEELSPGIVRKDNELRPIVAPSWSQRAAELGIDIVQETDQ